MFITIFTSIFVCKGSILGSQVSNEGNVKLFNSALILSLKSFIKRVIVNFPKKD